MKYSIEWSEKKTTSTGKEKIDATLKDEAGATHEKVTIWADFPNFATLMTGNSVDGDLVPAKDPKWGPTLYPPKTASHPTRSPSSITKAIERKEESIEKAQTNKEQGIKSASTMRMAVDTAIAFLVGEQIKDVGIFKEQVKRWRAFYWQEWDKTEDLELPF